MSETPSPRTIYGTEENAVTVDDLYDGKPLVHTFRHYGPLEAIDEVDAKDFSEHDFRANYFSQNRPLLIRNGLKVFDCGTAFANWDLLYLTEQCGTNRIHVRRNTISDEYKTGRAYMVQEIEFRHYIRDLVQNTPLAQNSYMAVQNLKKAFPQIAGELKFPSFFEKGHAGPFLWIAHAGHYEYTHMDPDDNILTVIRGRKLVRLYGCDVHAMLPNELGSKGRTIQSRIDCDDARRSNLDEATFNKFKSITCRYCVVKEGDILYFPAFWWHQVSSPVLTISVNWFFGDADSNAFTAKVLKSSQRASLMHWILNIIQQNRPFPSFNRLLVNLKESLRHFLYKQWHEQLSPEQIDEIYNEIIDYFKLQDLLAECLGNEAYTAKTKNPPTLRIRGLLMRDSNDGDENDDK